MVQLFHSFIFAHSLVPYQFARYFFFVLPYVLVNLQIFSRVCGMNETMLSTQQFFFRFVSCIAILFEQHETRYGQNSFLQRRTLSTNSMHFRWLIPAVYNRQSSEHTHTKPNSSMEKQKQNGAEEGKKRCAQIQTKKCSNFLNASHFVLCKTGHSSLNVQCIVRYVNCSTSKQTEREDIVRSHTNDRVEFKGPLPFHRLV